MVFGVRLYLGVAFAKATQQHLGLLVPHRVMQK